ncbi:hypothetical protein Anapl_07693 [Anas platyrhynchos]|uniref:Uncharacterized protein n=1 Tax=Anas platyrhynchos TaxID=8839 RepID=R0LPI7_ANAPL|nr:hypothetical protein Anapl_07693 [Anas platyrhynchos]
MAVLSITYHRALFWTCVRAERCQKKIAKVSEKVDSLHKKVFAISALAVNRCFATIFLRKDDADRSPLLPKAKLFTKFLFAPVKEEFPEPKFEGWYFKLDTHRYFFIAAGSGTSANTRAAPPGDSKEQVSSLQEFPRGSSCAPPRHGGTDAQAAPSYGQDTKGEKGFFNTGVFTGDFPGMGKSFWLRSLWLMLYQEHSESQGHGSGKVLGELRGPQAASPSQPEEPAAQKALLGLKQSSR